MTNSEDQRVRRATVVRIYDVRDTTVILAPDGRVHELHGSSAELARELLRACLEPRTRAELYAQVEQLTGAPLSSAERAVVDELLALFETSRVLVPASDTREPAVGHTRLVLGLTGAVATALAPSLIGALQRRGFLVRVIATESALRFVQAEVLEALVHHPVCSDMWPGLGSSGGALPVPHINLAQWADAVLIWPASATTISRLATGDYSNLVSAVALTTRAPVVVVPSMNVDMYASVAVQRNLRQLIDDGLHVVAPGSGHELADAPSERSVALGPAPPHDAVVAMLETVLRIARARGTHARIGPPRDAAEWDAFFRAHADQQLSWQRDELDDDLAAVLARELSSRPAGASVLDVGTGLGSAAIAAARLGARVVATDVSETALQRARARAGAAPIVWLRDDICETALQGSFDVILDRGCLHVLASESLPRYANALARLCAPDGVVVIKTHAPSVGLSKRPRCPADAGPSRERTRCSTTPYDAAAIESLLGFAFTLESDAASTMPGPEHAPEARVFVLRPRDSGSGTNAARDA